MAEMFLRRLTRWQADQQRESFADTYVEAYAGAAGEEFRDRQDFLQRFEEHTARPGFDLVVAEGVARMGCAYGFRVSRAGDWWRAADPAVRCDLEELTASGQVFLVADVMVLPPYRRRHVATRVLDNLLARSDAARAIALVGSGNPPAQAAFRSWSWTRIGPAGADPASGGSAPAPAGPALQTWSRLLEQ
jgi:GNAT superfamily N-acetyltransferase